MRLALLNTKETPRARYILEAIASGAGVFGDKCSWVRDVSEIDKIDQSDLGVQVCWPNRHHDHSPSAVFRLKVNDRLREQGKRVLTIDTGFVMNQVESELRQQRGQLSFDIKNVATYPIYDSLLHYSVGFDGIKREADYCCKDVAADRWENLKVRLFPWRTGKSPRARTSPIIIIGQTKHGLSSQHVDIYRWYRDVTIRLRSKTRRTIIFRSHPRLSVIRSSKNRRKTDVSLVREAAGGLSDFRFSTKRLLVDELREAWAVVAFTSNAAVDAAIAGVPTFACDPACMAWDVSSGDIANIERPTYPDRKPWVHRLAYSQWTIAEMRDGTMWKRLRASAQAPRTGAVVEWSSFC